MAKHRQWIHDESLSVADILEKFPPLTLGVKREINVNIHDVQQLFILHFVFRYRTNW